MHLDDTGGFDDTQPPPKSAEVLHREVMVLRLELQFVERERDHVIAVCEQAGINPWTDVFRPKPVSNEDALGVHNAQHPQCDVNGMNLIAEVVDTPTAEDVERAAADAIPVARWKGARS